MTEGYTKRNPVNLLDGESILFLFKPKVDRSTRLILPLMIGMGGFSLIMSIQKDMFYINNNYNF